MWRAVSVYTISVTETISWTDLILFSARLCSYWYKQREIAIISPINCTIFLFPLTCLDLHCNAHFFNLYFLVNNDNKAVLSSLIGKCIWLYRSFAWSKKILLFSKINFSKIYYNNTPSKENCEVWYRIFKARFWRRIFVASNAIQIELIKALVK